LFVASIKVTATNNGQRTTIQRLSRITLAFFLFTRLLAVLANEEKEAAGRDHYRQQHHYHYKEDIAKSGTFHIALKLSQIENAGISDALEP
jgi:hypothetical protein